MRKRRGRDISFFERTSMYAAKNDVDARRPPALICLW